VQAEIPVALATQVYDRYFEKFHKIRDWHREVIDEVRRTGIIHYPGDYYRIFFGRLDDESTWREAISSIPQATIAWTNHIVFTRMFYQLDGPEFNVLAHGHDAVLYQVKEGHRDEYHQRIKELQKVVWPIKGREMIVPWETKYGANWREVS
jgi:DNA polymerase I-like protein with 3'-5' exonuclease and polymerase domains